nr:hypothetical protein [Tanacetum cinerariifolium]
DGGDDDGVDGVEETVRDGGDADGVDGVEETV